MHVSYTQKVSLGDAGTLRLWLCSEVVTREGTAIAEPAVLFTFEQHLTPEEAIALGKQLVSGGTSLLMGRQAHEKQAKKAIPRKKKAK